MVFLRSLLFNLFFFAGTAILCILYLPTLLFPQPLFIKTVRYYFLWIDWMERYILGLHHEVRGLENLPKNGSYILASKHQSAYETYKLPLLFNAPAIVLKKELIKIPLWGWYARKAGAIPIDRSQGKKALVFMKDKAKAALAMQRPIIIYPQGTRISPEKEAPYKKGVIRLYEQLQIPIVPLALNSGFYWGKNNFIKKPGTVVFKILPPIAAGHDPKQVLDDLKNSLEKESLVLLGEANKKTDCFSFKT